MPVRPVILVSAEFNAAVLLAWSGLLIIFGFILGLQSILFPWIFGACVLASIFMWVGCSRAKPYVAFPDVAFKIWKLLRLLSVFVFLLSLLGTATLFMLNRYATAGSFLLFSSVALFMVVTAFNIFRGAVEVHFLEKMGEEQK